MHNAEFGIFGFMKNYTQFTFRNEQKLNICTFRTFCIFLPLALICSPSFLRLVPARFSVDFPPSQSSLIDSISVGVDEIQLRRLIDIIN